MTHHAPIAYTMADAVRITTLSRDTIYRMIRDGQIPDVKRRGRRLIPAASVIALIEPIKTPPADTRNQPTPASVQNAFRARLRAGRQPRPDRR